MKNVAKVIGINFLVLIAGLVIAELIFGSWLSLSPWFVTVTSGFDRKSNASCGVLFAH